MVVIVFGLPGSGKSYFASRLAERLGAIYVNSDQLRKDMFPQRSYSDQEKATVYDAMLKKMKEAISRHQTVVLDATFYKNAVRKLFFHEIEEESMVRFVEVTASEELTRRRLGKPRAYSEADFNVYKLINQEWEPFNEPHLTLESTNENIDEMLLKADRYLNETRKKE